MRIARFALPLLMTMAFSAQGDALDTPSCISVEVNGSRSPSYECLSQLMTPKQEEVTRQAPQFTSESITQRGPNELGLFNRAATQTRMGSNFGHSVQPYRPAPVPQAPPFH